MEYFNNGAVYDNSSRQTVFKSGANSFALGKRTKAASLTQSDLNKLASSFIPPELAEQAQLFRVDSTEGAEIVGRKATAHNDYSGIVFPYFFPEDTNPREYRLRRDNPDLEQKKDGIKEKGKYLSPPGRGNMIYFPPNCRKDLLEDTSIPIVITEGEKKTLALHRASWHGLSDSSERPRFVAIGLSGVWNFKGTIGKTNDYGERKPIKGVISDFEFVQWQDRETTILFDANTATNEGVQAARLTLARELINFGANVFLANLPEIEDCNGIDDILGKFEREQNEDKACEFLFDLLEKSKNQPAVKPHKTSLFEVRNDGVYSVDLEGNEIRICSKLEVKAVTRDINSESWGRWLEYYDLDGRKHVWAMPMNLLSGDGNEYRAKLLSTGLEITPSRKAKELLANYIQTAETKEKYLCVSRVGWFNGTFVFPNETISNSQNAEKVIFQSEHFADNRLETKGTLQEWREKIARYCAGNSRLVFAVSAAFAGCLLPLLDEQGGGFHFRGSSSLGKTTALLVAGSVWGGGGKDGFLQTWRSTASGLEAIAEMHNNGLLCLDEIGECEGHTIGKTAYMLANGQGKTRMARSVSLRKSLEWNLIFLSSGEIGLTDLITQAGEKVRGGHEVRMIDLETDAGARFGLFENLHDFNSANAFADHLRTTAKEYYGSPIREYLRMIINHTDELKTSWQKFRIDFSNKFLPSNSVSEVQRVCTKFAFIAFAGETARKLTGWNDLEAVNASAKMFQTWLTNRSGNGQTDTENAIRQVRHFLELHGASRFQSINLSDEKVLNRAGFKRINSNDETEYLIMPEVFRKEICKGFDAKFVANELAKRGFLLKGNDRKNTQNIRVENIQQRFYILTSDIFEVGSTESDEIVEDEFINLN
jgi:uncharacterized protein (DUF927 family)